MRSLKTIISTAIFISLIFYSNSIFAACRGSSPEWSAESLAPSDINDCISAASPGDTINLPPGSYTYESDGAKCPTSNSACIVIDKGVNIKGAGVGNTILTDKTGGLSNQVVFRAMSSNFRISNIEFTGPFPKDNGRGVILVVGPVTGYRIDHCKFSGFGGRGNAIGINTTAYSNSVIDHNQFIETTDGHHSAILVTSFNTNGDALWLQKWDGPGSNDYLFIEDNIFIYNFKNDSAMQAGNGCRVVFRYNIVKGTVIDAHGAGSSNRGVRIYEVYNNTFNGSLETAKGRVVRAISLRGGTHIIHNNTIDNYSHPIFAQTYRPCYGAPGFEAWTKTFHFSNKNTCDGTQPIDENSTPFGYWCKDQIGVISGAPGNQTRSPLYEWNNKESDGTDVDIEIPENTGCARPMSDYIKEGRDYYNDTVKPGYTPFVYPHPLRGESSPLSRKTTQQSVPGTPSGIKVKTKQ